MPKLEWAGLVRVFGGVAWPKVEEVVGQALAGSILVQPSSVDDLQSEELRPTIDRFYRFERRYGTFRRHIPLPEGVNAEQVTATFKDGILEIAMPAPQRQGRGRRIDIQSGATSPSGAPGGPGQQGASNAHQEPARTTAGGA